MYKLDADVFLLHWKYIKTNDYTGKGNLPGEALYHLNRVDFLSIKQFWLLVRQYKIVLVISVYECHRNPYNGILYSMQDSRTFLWNSSPQQALAQHNLSCLTIDKSASLVCCTTAATYNNKNHPRPP